MDPAKQVSGQNEPGAGLGQPGLLSVLWVGLSLAIGWGIRGNFGHEYGAMIPGMLATLAAVLLSGRSDWHRRAVFFAFFGALGWSFGGSISYMQVIAYTHSGHSGSQLYGFSSLFVIGFLWAAMGGAGAALPAFLNRERLTAFFIPLTAVFVGWTFQDYAVAKWFPDNPAYRHENPLYWFDTDWLAALVAIVAVLIVAAVRRQLDAGSSLILHMAVGWWIGFLVLVNLFGWRMTPPRGDNWAGCVGMVGGMWVYFQRNGLSGVTVASLVCGCIGGFGFASGQLLKLLGVSTGWPTNWHSILEQTYGFINGIGLAVALFWVARHAPKSTEEPPVRKWAEPYAAFFVLLIVTYINLVKNPGDWVKAKAMPPLLYGISAEAWFNLAYLLLACVFLVLLWAHRCLPLPLLSTSWLARAQLLYLVFLWVMVIGNFERALVGFAPQRLVTEGIIFLNAALCTVGIFLSAPANRREPAGSEFSWSRMLPKVVVVGLIASALSVLIDWAVVRAVFGDRHVSNASLHIRFGPNATATKKNRLPEYFTPDFMNPQFRILALFILTASLFRAPALDLRNAVVVSPPNLSGPEQKAISMLVEEVEKRSHVRWPSHQVWPNSDASVILVGNRSALEQFSDARARGLPPARGANAAEGFQLSVKAGQSNSIVFIVGNDARGVLFGVGRLLRELRMQRGRVTLADDLDIATAPKYPLRGHQLGYRPKTHSYDAWDLPTWEQYYRDLAVFGCNTVELIPPRSDDDADSPHFPRPPMEMMIDMSRLADSYGLDVWIWYPAMDKDYSDPKTVEFALHEWGEVFAKLPRVDALFVPGGDPGHTQPKFLMPLLEKQSTNLHRYHPKAKLWMAPQGFSQAWLDEFFEILKRDQPTWLHGLVYGPQVRVSLPELRRLTPSQYPIRHYPDITHSRQCQFPVPEWDTAFAVTQARECINPRPEDHAAIFRKMQPDTIGFITYSEGCNDDVNKAVWSALGWDPETKVVDALRDYSRYFIGEKFTEDFAQGLLALERNWRGPLISNDGVDSTLKKFQAIEKAASPADLKNWRLQQALFRAYYDAYLRHRLIWETDLETQAMTELRTAPTAGVPAALAATEKILNRAKTEHVQDALRLRVHELAAALFQSISMQLSVTKYQAIAVDRGASLDTLDFPVNNRLWLEERFKNIRKVATTADQLKAIDEILHWTDPGPGGFYDDLGNVGRQPHLVKGLSFADDPSRMKSVRIDFEDDLIFDEPEESAGTARRISWVDHAESLYDMPLRIHYSGLDSSVRYKLRVVYGGDNQRKIRLVANDTVEIHPYITKPFPFKAIEFAIPANAIKDGDLNLTWFGQIGLGGNGRNTQVSEVWLVKESPAPAK